MTARQASMNQHRYVIATRGSKLALYQANLVRQQLHQLFPQHHWMIETFTTTGDRILDRPLTEVGGKGVFLKEIEEALLSGKADLAVHSLKDVPGIETEGLQLSAFLKRDDPRDVWISDKDELMHLEAGSTVGTSSLRRAMLVGFYRPDIKVEMLRGNLDTRLRKLNDQQYDAIVLAAAGLHRLQLFDEARMQYLSEDAFIPAIGQGVMVVQTKSGNSELHAMIRMLNDNETEIAARIERALLARYEGGCHLPIGALAQLKDQTWHLRAFLAGVNSRRVICESVQAAKPEECAPLMFSKLQQQGADGLLAELK